MKRKIIYFLILLLAVTVTAQEATEEPTKSATVPEDVVLYVPEVLETYEHDPLAYTQGLVLHEGYFYESAGKYGESTLRKVDPETGEVVQSTDVDDIFFAEGLALVEDKLIQLTWKEGLAIVYDVETFEITGFFEYTGEGWGLCYDGEVFYMTDGSDNLFIRDAETFELISQLPVTFMGVPVDRVNELECVDEYIYANVWQENFILQIDKETGVVTGIIDTIELLTPEEYAELESGEVLNGIAYDAEKEVFYLTGKHWPKVFEVKFVEQE